MKSCILLAALVAIFLHGASAQSDERKPNLRNGVITVYAGDYQATFSFGHRWNLSSLSYANTEVIPPGGANQFNICTKMADGAVQWYGGIANPEEIKSVTLYVDDAPEAIPANEAGRNHVISPAGSYTLEKISKVGPYEVTLRTTLNTEGLSEEVVFRAVETTEQVELIYASRFSFGSRFSAWFATVSDGFEEEGDFGKTGETVVNQPTSSLGLFDVQDRVVALLTTQGEPVREGNKHFVWHNAQSLHFHCKMSPDAGDTEPVSVRRHLSIWSLGESEADWREQVRAHIAEKQ